MRKITELYQNVMPYKVRREISATYEETVILGMMPVQQRQRLPLSAKTESFFTLSIAITTEARCRQQSVPSRKFMTGFRKVQRLSTPAQPDTVKH